MRSFTPVPPSLCSQLPLPHAVSLVHDSPAGERHRSTPKHTALLPLAPQGSWFT